MNGVCLISRHREWRAWQFGMRHSGAMRGSCGGMLNGRNDPPAPWWFTLLLVGACVTVVVLLLVAPQAGKVALLVVMLLIAVALIVGVVRSFFRK